MLTTIGLFFALLTSFAGTASSTITQYFKVDPSVMAIYRGLGIALILLPFLIFVPYPTSPMFYLLVCANGLIASLSFRLITTIIQEHGANIASKFLTVPPVFVAIAWWVIRPIEFAAFVDADPLKAGGAMFCLAGMIFTIFALGHNKYTHKALVASIPLFVCYTAQTFLTFFAIKELSILQGMFYYVFLQGLIVGTINYFVHVHHLKGHVKEDLLLSIFDKKIMKAGLLFVFTMIIARFCTNIALKLLPNPAYVPLIANLQIIWIFMLSKKLKLKNAISPKKGVILAIYAITFIMLTY